MGCYKNDNDVILFIFLLLTGDKKHCPPHKYHKGCYDHSFKGCYDGGCGNYYDDCYKGCYDGGYNDYYDDCNDGRNKCCSKRFYDGGYNDCCKCGHKGIY